MMFKINVQNGYKNLITEGGGVIWKEDLNNVREPVCWDWTVVVGS